MMRPPLGLEGRSPRGPALFVLERKMHPYAALQFCAKWVLALKGDSPGFAKDEWTSTDDILDSMTALLAAFSTAQLKDRLDRNGYHKLLVRIPDQVILGRIFDRLRQADVPPELASWLIEHERAVAKELVEEHGETWRDDPK